MHKRHYDRTEAMTEATALLARAGIPCQVMTDYHLKVKHFNFWPGTGAISIDGEMQKRPEKGMPAFMRLLREAGLAERGTKKAESGDDPAGFIRAADSRIRSK